ncbi:MAG: DNA ligase [Syntrophomonadaceae bacterium]|nr:DNA ligase [Bacillota bacterium]
MEADRYPLPQVLEIMKPKQLDLKKPREAAKLQQYYKDPNFIAEEKIDGCHYVSIEGRFFSTRISATTGQPVEKSSSIPHLGEALLKLGMPKLILDGEISYPGWKSSDIVSIMGCLPQEAVLRQQRDKTWMHYRVFDVLRDPNGNWLINQPWKIRREVLESLEEILRKACPQIEILPVVRRRKEQFLEQILSNGGEGIVLKDINGLYYPGKRPTGNWIKIKIELDDDVIITGFEPATRIYTGGDRANWSYWEGVEPVTKYHALGWIGAIKFGKYKDGKIIELGRCSGIDETVREQMSKTPDAFIGRVITIKAMEQTPDGFYRHPRFIKFHSDKSPHECAI